MPGKILMLNYEYPPLGGGAGVITQNISEGLVKLGYSVTVVTTWFEGEKELEQTDKLTIYRLRSKRKYIFCSNPLEMLSWNSKAKIFLNGLLQKEKFDLCFAHFALPCGDTALFLNKKFGLPFVIMSHGHDIPWFFPKQMLLYHIFTYFWIKKICSASSLLFVQSEDMRANALNFLGNRNKDKIVLIPNGGNVRQFFPNPQLKSDRFKIIFVGRLVKQKDPFTFLKAVRLFSLNNYDFVVHILGDGPLRKKMENYVNKNNLRNNVKFKGWVSKEELLEEYQSANLKVAPSLEEGMSISIMESLACGQYILATPVSNNNLLIRENINGELINLKDYRIIADKMQRFYREKFKSGYLVPDEVIDEYRKNWDWERIVAMYSEKIEELLRQKHK